MCSQPINMALISHVILTRNMRVTIVLLGFPIHYSIMFDFASTGKLKVKLKGRTDDIISCARSIYLQNAGVAYVSSH